MLDTDLAVFYKMDAKVLNQAIKGNVERFSPNFMFQLTASEYEFLRSQIVTLNKKTTKTPKHLNILNDIII